MSADASRSWSLPDYVVEPHPAARPWLEQSVSFADLRARWRQRSEASRLRLIDRRRIVEQAIVLFEQNYVHLPLKRAMFGVDPVQRLRLLRYRLERDTGERDSEAGFYREILAIFASVRDPSTRFILPWPYRGWYAYLPFVVSRHDADGVPRFLVTSIVPGWAPTAGFAVGAEIRYWNGVQIRRAIDRLAETDPGCSLEVRRASAVGRLTVRPLACAPVPRELWVDVGFRTIGPDGRPCDTEIRLPWRAFPDPPALAAAELGEPLSAVLLQAVREAGVGSQQAESELRRRAKLILFRPELVGTTGGEVEDENELAPEFGRPSIPRIGTVAPFAPSLAHARRLLDGDQAFAVVRIRSFSAADPRAFVVRFARLLERLPRAGLIIDLRGNGGGDIAAAEGLLQLFTPRPIEPEQFQILNTDLNLRLARRYASPPEQLDALGLHPAERSLGLERWVASIEQSVATGATYSRGFPLTDPKFANALGQRYPGPLVLITDAETHGAAAIFVAGFQDHKIGPVLGASLTTGGGGGRALRHAALEQLAIDGVTTSPYEPLPLGSEMLVAFLRALRVQTGAGTPIEEVGVMPDAQHALTAADVLHGGVDLYRRAAAILRGLDRSLELRVEVVAGAVAQGSAELIVHTRGVDRCEVQYDGLTRCTLTRSQPIDPVDSLDRSFVFDIGPEPILMARLRQGRDLLVHGYSRVRRGAVLTRDDRLTIARRVTYEDLSRIVGENQ